MTTMATTRSASVRAVPVRTPTDPPCTRETVFTFDNFTVDGAPTQLRFGCGTGASCACPVCHGHCDGRLPSGVRGQGSGDEVLGLRVMADDSRGRLLGVELEPLAHFDPDAVGPE